MELRHDGRAVKRLAALGSRSGGLPFELLVGLSLKGGGAVASLVLNLLLARALGGGAVGEFQLALATAWLPAAVALLGLDMLVMRVVSVGRQSGDLAVARASVVRGAAFTLGVGTALGIGLWLLSGVLAVRLFDQPGLAPLLRVMAATVPLLAFIRMASGALRGAGRLVVSQSLDGVFYTGIAALILASVLLAGGEPWRLIAPQAFLVGCIAAAVFGAVALRRTVAPWPAGAAPDVPLRAGVPLLGTLLLLLTAEWASAALLTREHGSLAAGNYRVIFQFCGLFLLVFNSFGAIVGPHLAAAHAAGDIGGIVRVMRVAQLAGAGICLPLLLALLAMPGPLLALFDPAFAAGATALRIFAVAHFFNVCMGPLGSVLVMTHREHMLLRIEIFTTLTAIGVSIALIPSLGVTGAAIAGAGAVTARNIVTALVVRHRLNELRRDQGTAAGA